MDFDQITRLGKRIEQTWGRLGHDAAALPEVARDALVEADLERELDLVELTTRALDWQHPSSKGSGDGELNVPLFESRDFFIELVAWTRGSAAIEEHAYAGAFQVIAGSSIQSTYGFEQTRRVSTHALTGRLTQKTAEVLEAGDVRPIHPGRDGLRHSLFHLESPTALLVVRTRRLPGFRAPMTHFPPTLAIATRELDQDRQASRTVRAISLAGALSTELQFEALAAALPELDIFRRLFAALTAQPANRELRGRYLEAVPPFFGDLAGDVSQAIRHNWLVHDALRARARLDDPFLRFVFAAAVTASDEQALRALVSSRFPTGDTFELIVDQMCALIDDEKLSVVWDEETREEGLLRSFLRGDSTAEATRAYALSSGREVNNEARETVAEAFTLMTEDAVLSMVRPLIARFPELSNTQRLS